MSESPRFTATRKAGIELLDNFASRAGLDYARSRNYDNGPHDRGNVSMLSPYLRHRLVTEQEVLSAVLRRHPQRAAGKFIEELFWRGYFKGWLEQHPTVWAAYREQVAQHLVQLEADDELRDRYEIATTSKTGIHCFDAWAAELTETGYLHNHARMWFASIWVFTLNLPWQLGADFFYRHLADGDPASNTLGWRWVSGLHTKGKTYLARASNIAKYTNNRFSFARQLAPRAAALSENEQHPVRPLPDAQSMQKGERFGLLLTEEDSCPESLGLTDAPQQVVAAMATEDRSPLDVGQAARDFAIGAVSDALARTMHAYRVPGRVAQADDWGSMLTDWAAEAGFGTIVTAYTPVGPVAQRLAQARPELDKRGIRLLQVRRDYDSLAWPHASKGYFKLKSRIPAIMRQLGIAGGIEESVSAEA